MLRKFQDRFKNHGKIWFCKVKKISPSRKGRGKPRRTRRGRKMQLERDEVSQATVRGIWKSEPRKLTKSSDPCHGSDTSSITLWSLGIPAYSRQLREAPLSLLHNSSLRAPFYISKTTQPQTQMYNSRNDRFNCSFIHCRSIKKRAHYITTTMLLLFIIKCIIQKIINRYQFLIFYTFIVNEITEN